MQFSTSSFNLLPARLFTNDYFCSMKILMLIITALALLPLPVMSQTTLRVLFLGNSYTAANNLPGMVADVAASAGETVVYDSNTPGGFTLQGHSGDAGSLLKIAAGGWDYVVLQEQSQLPSFPASQVNTQMFPFAQKLDSLILVSNPCAETVFYMTWGRKNGDASNCPNWPPVCTYAGMDSLLRMRYMMMATDNQAIVSPAGAVWRYLRSKHPQIELYEADESHPSVAGTYAVACSFFTTLFRKDPTLITFSSTLQTGDASLIRDAVKAVVFDSLSYWLIGTYEPKADFSFSQSLDTVSFTNQSLYASGYDWDFGDGKTDTTANPVHVYTQNGTYTVLLKADHCGLEDTISKTVQVVSIGLNPGVPVPMLKIFPNPAADLITLQLPEEFAGKKASILIYSQNGQLVKSEILPECILQCSISVSGLPAGLWMASIATDHNTPIRGFFVKKP